jgi:hypothetical protein
VTWRFTWYSATFPSAILTRCSLTQAAVTPRRVQDRDERSGRVVVSVEGQRRGEGRTRQCRYDVRSGDADFDDQS